MMHDTDFGLEVMQVCLNGHVITDRLCANPESGRAHCERCGAPTIDHCGTCGTQLPGVAGLPDLTPIGAWPAPRCCLRCGAPFPWARRPRPAPDAFVTLEPMLRRVPRVIRELRWRQSEHPPFRVEDERDLEDLLRALLSLHFDEVRLESRTPRYSARTRTDLVLASQKIAITVKVASANLQEAELVEQWTEDVEYYKKRGAALMLISFIYDPEGLVREPRILQSRLLETGVELEVRSVVAG